MPVALGAGHLVTKIALIIAVGKLDKANAATSWERRSAASRQGHGQVPTPIDSSGISQVVEALSTLVRDEVEPAIAKLRVHEQLAGNQEDCFSAASGLHLRYRCCVYFSTLAAALIERRHGWPPSRVRGAAESPYAAMARWFLAPPDGASLAVRGLAADLINAAQLAGESYTFATLRVAASRLPGPLGKYAARLRIGSVDGTLWRCEVSTVHTFLVFQADNAPAMDAVIVDVTFKQFMVVGDWMTASHFEACAQAQCFSEHADAFVGTADELARVYTLSALDHTMQRVLVHDSRWTAETNGQDESGTSLGGASNRNMSLAEVHRLRNDGVFGLNDREAHLRNFCGKPSQ